MTQTVNIKHMSQAAMEKLVAGNGQRALMDRTGWVINQFVFSGEHARKQRRYTRGEGRCLTAEQFTKIFGYNPL